MPNDDQNPISPTKKMKAISEPQLRSTVRPLSQSGAGSPSEESPPEPKSESTPKSAGPERSPYKPQPSRVADSQGEELRRQLREMEEERRVRRKKQKGFMGGDNFFAFNSYWSTTLIKVVYFIGFLIINATFILAIVSSGFRSGPFVMPGVDPFYGGINDAGTLVALFGSFVVAWILANVIWRLFCEAVVIRFKTYELLRSVEEKLQVWEIERKSERSGN